MYVPITIKPWRAIEVLPGEVAAAPVVILEERDKEIREALSTDELHDKLIIFTQGRSDMGTWNPAKDSDYPYICFNVSYFIASLWTSDNAVFGMDEYKDEVSYDVFKDLEGVYLVGVLIGNENHNFVMYARGSTITIYNSLGGTCGFFLVVADRTEWMNDFGNLRYPKGNKGLLYAKLFGFDEGMTSYLSDDSTLDDLQIYTLYGGL